MVDARMLTSIADALHLNHALADTEPQSCGLMLDEICQCWGFDRPRHTTSDTDEVDIRPGSHCQDIRKIGIFALNPRYQAAVVQ